MFPEVVSLKKCYGVPWKRRGHMQQKCDPDMLIVPRDIYEYLTPYRQAAVDYFVKVGRAKIVDSARVIR